MQRRDFLKLAGVSALGLACVPRSRAATKAGEVSDPPNVIVVNLDDIGPAWFPPYAREIKPENVEEKICEEYAKLHEQEGSFDLNKHLEAARHSMPFLDNLARHGRVFDRCFSTSSLCSPSRSGLLTGCYQERWGAFFITDVTQSTGIPAEVPVLAENFQKAGYACGMIGKWHVSLQDAALLEAARKQFEEKGARAHEPMVHKAADTAFGYSSSCAPGQSPLNRGFDYYFGYNLDHSHYYETDNLWGNQQRVPKRPAGEFLTDLLNGKCLEFVTRALSAHKRFLLYYAPMSMHGSLMPPPEKYSSQFHTGIKFSDDWAGHLLAVDEGLRNIYAQLKAQGQDQNTLLMFTADNGQTGYRVPPYNAPYRGGKGTGWLGGSHEPLIIAWPAQLTGGMHHELVSQMDVFATALDAAGLTPTRPIDGRSLLPLMQGKTKISPHAEIFSAGLHSTNWSDSYFDPQTLELRRQKNEGEPARCPYYAWVQNPESVLMYITTTQAGLYSELPKGRPGQKLFFDLQDDPREEKNIFADTPAVKAAAGKLGGWLRQTQPPHFKHLADHKELLRMSGE